LEVLRPKSFDDVQGAHGFLARSLQIAACKFRARKQIARIRFRPPGLHDRLQSNGLAHGGDGVLMRPACGQHLSEFVQRRCEA